MRRTSLVLLALALILINACGRMTLVSPGQSMSENDALTTLLDVPMTQQRAARIGKNHSVEGLNQLLQDLVASGQVRASANIRGATSGSVDLSQLSNIFTLLQSGQATSLLGLAQGLVNSTGSTTGTGSTLMSIVALLQAAMPIIMVIAPQYAPIIQAIIVILPIVIQFISMMRKPKPVPSAAIQLLVPNWA